MGERYADFQSMMERYKKEMKQYYTKRMPAPEAGAETAAAANLIEISAAEGEILSGVPGAAAAEGTPPGPCTVAVQPPQEIQPERPCKPETAAPEKKEPAAEAPISYLCRPADEGYIIVKAYTGKAAIPVEGADIAIYKEDYGKKELISLQETGEEGSTPRIAVKTAKRESSELPGQMMPYAIYYVNAWAPHYYPVINRRVDVFGGEITSMEIKMQPLPEEKPGTPTEERTSG